MIAKLTTSQAAQVRALLQCDPRPTYAEIGRLFGISASAVGQLVRGETAAYRIDDPQDEPSNFYVEDDEECLDAFLDRLEDEPEVTIELPEDEDAPLAIGEVVTLRSGSPPMTVERVDVLPSGKTVTWACWWTDQGPMSTTINPSTVQRVA